MGQSAVTLGNPAPLGLLCFGMTTLTLMYVDMGWCEKDFEVQIAALALALGGFGQILVAIIEILKGSSFSFAVFGCYGSFWVTWAIAFLYKTSLAAHTDTTFAHSTGSALYMAQWGILTCCFWVVTWRKNMALILIFGLLTATFFILSAATATGSETVRMVGGYFGFFTALGAFYTGAAELINEEYGQHLLPGLRPIHTPYKWAISPESIQALMSYDKTTNTVFFRFRSLQIKTMDDVDAIEKGIDAFMAMIDPPDMKVHVIADYDHTYIMDAVAPAYWAMAGKVQAKYYLSVTRFHVSSFNTTNHALPPNGVAYQMAPVGFAKPASTSQPPEATATTMEEHSDFIKPN
jgi:uncharacterized protein